MGLAIVQKIKTTHFDNQCRNFILYGPLGYGKTSYAMQILMEIYKTKDVEVLKRYFAFTPLEFLRMVRHFDKQVPAVVWDDAGVWLYYMDYAHPVVKQLGKMLQMIRTRTASVIFTTPMPTLILGKLRNFPQTLTVKITKISGNQYQKDLRRAVAYQSWLLPDLQKLRVKKKFIDDFSVMLPHEIYDWLTKNRETYVKLLENEVEKCLPSSMRIDVV